jgi:hypothetical protein
MDSQLAVGFMDNELAMTRYIINAADYINMLITFKRSHNRRNTDNNDNNIYKYGSEQIVENYRQDQYLTLEDVCPTWCKKLRLGLAKKDRDTMARDSKYCLVGEAWGFTGRHAGYYLAPLIPFIGCWTCVKYGNKMGEIARRQPATINLHLSDLEPTITEFLRHWNERHKDITEKLKR